MKKTRPHLFSFLFFVCYAACLPALCEAAGSAPDAASFVPAETIVLAEISDFGDLRKQFEQTDLYGLYKSPAMSAFVADFKKRLSDKVGQSENKIAQAVFDAGVLPEGRVALALVMNQQAKDDKEPAFLFFSEWGEAAAKIKEAAEKTVEKAVEEGAHKKTEGFRGVTIITLIKEGPAEQLPAASGQEGENGNTAPTASTEPAREEIHYCFLEDSLLVGGDMELVKFAVAHIKGATRASLAESADYSDTRKAVGPERELHLYVNIRQILKVMIDGDATGRTQTVVTGLGLDNVNSLACSLGVGPSAGGSFCAQALLKIEGVKKGICRILEPESAGLRVPRFVPESAVALSFFNLNIRKSFDELANVLSGLSPQAASVMYMPLLPASPDGEPGVQLRRDVIEHLGSQVLIAQTVNKPFAVGSMLTDTYIAIGANNRSALEKSLGLLHSKLLAPNQPDARRELLGHTIYVLDMSGFLPGIFPGARTPMQAGPAMPASKPPKFAFTVTDSELVLGTEAVVEKAVRALGGRDAASVDSAEWFRRAKSAIPSAVGAATLQNDRASTELTWWMLKQSAKEQGGGGESETSVSLGIGSNLNMFLSETGLDLFDFNLLPEFDAVSRYFGMSAYYGISRPDGFFFEFKELNPPE